MLRRMPRMMLCKNDVTSLGPWCLCSHHTNFSYPSLDSLFWRRKVSLCMLRSWVFLCVGVCVCLKYLYWYLLYISSLKSLFPISCINLLKAPDWQKYQVHRWFLYDILNIYKFLICFAHVYGLTTFKTKITFRITDYSKPKSQPMSMVYNAELADNTDYI